MPSANPSRELAVRARPSYLAAVIVALCFFALYVATLSPNTAMWDTSEYLAAAYTLGLPHPPGNPLFILLGRVFSLLPLGSASAAVRINLLAAATASASAGMWFLFTERVLEHWLPQRWLRITGGVLAALIGGTAFTVWNQAVVNEKVYTVSLLIIAIISWLTLCWLDHPDGPAADRLLIVIAYLIGLGYANHPAGFLAIPAVGIAILVARPRSFLRWRVVLIALGALVLGLTPFAVEPIRAAYFPALDEGEPTGCARHIAVGCTLSDSTLARLEANINRTQYRKPSVLDRQAPFVGQLGMWWLYFKWQWLRDPAGAHPAVQTVLAFVFFLLGLLGGYEHWKRDPPSFWYFAALLFTLTLALIYYLNFKYGYTQCIQMGQPRAPTCEVRDRDYFYIWSFSAWGVWAALGFVGVWERLAALGGSERVVLGGDGVGAGARAPRRTVEVPSRRGWLIASPLLAIACIPLFVNWSSASRAGQTFTRDWAADLLNSVEPYGILVTNGDNDTFPLWYAQQVEGIRKDVIVGVTTYLATDWFLRQIVRRPVEPYNAAGGPAIYRGRTWPEPSGPPLSLTFGQLDSLPPFVMLPKPELFEKGQISAVIPAGPLTRDQIVVLRMIQDAYPTRPLYFAAAEYPQHLGLGKYLVTEGLAVRLAPDSVVPGHDTVAVPGAVVDVARTDSLWRSVYRGPNSLIRQGQWIDAASSDIPAHYLYTGAILAEALARQGKRAEADSIVTTLQQMARAAGLQGMLTGAGP